MPVHFWWPRHGETLPIEIRHLGLVRTRKARKSDLIRAGNDELRTPNEGDVWRHYQYELASYR